MQKKEHGGKTDVNVLRRGIGETEEGSNGVQKARPVESTIMGLRRSEGDTGGDCLTLCAPASYLTSSHILHVPAQELEVKAAKVSQDGNN